MSLRPHYLRPLASTLQAALLGQAMGPRIIRSIQRGTITFASSALTGTATITAVDLTRAIVTFNGFSVASATTAFNGGNGPNIWALSLELTNGTTVTGTVGADLGAGTWSIPYEVIEFWPGAVKNIQRGSVTVGASSATGTATITAVVLSNAFLLSGGFRSANLNGPAQIAQGMPMAFLTNTTTVTITRGASGGGTYTLVMPYTVVEMT